MLAYIFWHWPFPAVETAEYEHSQLAFHRALDAARPARFDGSWLLRLEGAPWLTAGPRLYEDWYLVADFADLGPLNDAVVNVVAREAHARAAGLAEAGAGALYRLRDGQPRIAESPIATWITKPRSMSYDQFYPICAELIAQPGSSLWRRQMVLGPAPEFCLLSPAEQELPAELAGVVVRRELVAG